MNLLSPTSAPELAEILRDAAARQEPLETGGNFSKTSWGGPAAPASTRLSTAGLNGVLQYEPRDLTISVGAGIPYSTLSSLLAEHRQMIPLDPPYADRSTLGGILAANLSGPRRRLYGTARDLVIGMTFATTAGELIQSGGMVVKNVAGLDMGKLLIGSYGTLGVITSINCKLIPIPPLERTYVREFATAAEALAERSRLLAGVLQPAGIDLLNPAAARLLGFSGFTLLVPVGGSAAVIARYERELAGYQATEAFAALRELPATWLAQHPQGAIARVTGRLSDLAALLDTETRPVLSRAATGVSYVHLADAAEPFPGLLEAGARPGSTPWPQPGGDFAVMEKIKNLLDPHRVLNRGRLHGRI